MCQWTIFPMSLVFGLADANLCTLSLQEKRESCYRSQEHPSPPPWIIGYREGYRQRVKSLLSSHFCKHLLFQQLWFSSLTECFGKSCLSLLSYTGTKNKTASLLAYFGKVFCIKWSLWNIIFLTTLFWKSAMWHFGSYIMKSPSECR